VSIVAHQVAHLYNKSNAVAVLQLCVLGSSEQATSGKQMTKEFQCFCTTNMCAEPVHVEHSRSMEMERRVKIRVVKSGQKRDGVSKQASWSLEQTVQLSL